MACLTASNIHVHAYKHTDFCSVLILLLDKLTHFSFSVTEVASYKICSYENTCSLLLVIKAAVYDLFSGQQEKYPGLPLPTRKKFYLPCGHLVQNKICWTLELNTDPLVSLVKDPTSVTTDPPRQVQLIHNYNTLFVHIKYLCEGNETF